jgi:hypothetical protein
MQRRWRWWWWRRRRTRLKHEHKKSSLEEKDFRCSYE